MGWPTDHDLGDAVPALLETLEDGNPLVRSSAAYALGLLGLAAKDAVPALVEALKADDARVREVAAEALQNIEQASKEAP